MAKRIYLRFDKNFLKEEGLTKEGMEKCLAILTKRLEKFLQEEDTELEKSFQEHDFAYFKKRALACLKKQYDALEKEEKENKNITKAFSLAEIEIEKAFPVGTIRTWKGKKFIKSPDKKWRPYYENHKMRGEKLALAALAKKINALQDGDYEGLYRLLTLHRSRFTSDKNLINDLYNAMKERGELGSGRFSKKEGAKTEKKPEKVEVKTEIEPEKVEAKPEAKKEIKTGKKEETKESKVEENIEKENKDKKVEKVILTEEENRALAVLQSIPPITTKPGGWQPIYNTNVGEDSIYFNIGSIDKDSSFKGIIKNNIDCDEKRLLAIIALIVDAITNGKCIKTEEKPSSIPWEKSPSISKRLEKNGVVISTYQQTERYATKVESVDTETNKEAFEKAIKDFEAKIDESEGFEYQSEKGKWSDMLEYIKKVKSTVKTEITKKALEAKDKKLRDSPTAENMIEYLDDAKVKHNPVGEKREKPLEDEEIIDRLANFDGTRGSCVSLAFAYVAQTMGYDVLDFRGGASKKAFARHGIDVMRHFFKNVYQANGIVDPHESALDCLSSVKLGPEEKPYLLSAGHHCAIVRRNKDREVQYLELQGGGSHKGWKNFDKTPKEERGELNKYGFSKDFEEKLVDRFGTKEEKVNRSTLIDFNSGLWPEHTDDFLKIMGYINTEGDKQKVLTREQWEKENSKLH